ncbi:hypothetical protein ES703_122445 [subsurface metagenome]
MSLSGLLVIIRMFLPLLQRGQGCPLCRRGGGASSLLQKYFSSELKIKQIQCYSCLYKAKGVCTPTGFKEDRLPVYKPREKNVIQEILQDHFKSFEENYDTQYSGKYGKYRIIRIKEAVEKFIECLKRNHAPPFNKITTKAS